MVKMTFTVDERTAARLRQAATRLTRPQSEIVRDAINEYADRIGRLGEDERRRLLDTLDALATAPVTRTRRAVQAELTSIRKARRAGGRRTRARRSG